MEIGTLIVDDDEDIRLIIRLIIEAANQGLFVAGEAANGREALDRLDDIDPKVVVLDQMMPGMTGLETASLILERKPGQIMILCSAYLDDEVRRQAEAAGIRICLSKEQVQEIPHALEAAAGSDG